MRVHGGDAQGQVEKNKVMKCRDIGKRGDRGGEARSQACRKTGT